MSDQPTLYREVVLTGLPPEERVGVIFSGDLALQPVESSSRLFLCWSSVKGEYMKRGHSAMSGCNKECGWVDVVRVEDHDE